MRHLILALMLLGLCGCVPDSTVTFDEVRVKNVDYYSDINIVYYDRHEYTKIEHYPLKHRDDCPCKKVEK